MDSDSDSDVGDDRINIYEGVPEGFEKKICTAPLDFQDQDKSDGSEKLSVKIELTSSSISGLDNGTIQSILSLEDDISPEFVEILSEGESDRASVEAQRRFKAKEKFWMHQVFYSFTSWFMLTTVFIFVFGGVCLPLWKKLEDHNATYLKVQCTITSANVDMGTLSACNCGTSCFSTYPCLRVTASYTDPVTGAPSSALLTSRFENSANCYENLTQWCHSDPALNVQTVQAVLASLPLSLPRTCHLARATPHLVADGDKVPNIVSPASCTGFSLLPAVVSLFWFKLALMVYCRRYHKNIIEARLARMKSGSLLMKPN